MKNAILCITILLYSLGLKAQASTSIQQTKAQTTESQRTMLRSLLIDRINQITLAPQPKNSEVAQEFIDISQRGEYVDVMIKELFLCVELPEDMMSQYISNFSLATGQWSDIDYTNMDRSGWKPGYHPLRLYSLARSYMNPQSKHHQSKVLQEIILRAINYWHSANLVCPNWWYNDIGVPKLMGPVYLLFKDMMNKEQYAGAIKVMDRSKFRMTGQNKVALAGNIMMRALLENNMDLVARARDTIASEIYMSQDEGLQSDFSFHQHGPMMQFGNYGLAYIASMAYWGRVLSDTELAFDQQKTQIISQYALQAMRWTVWRGEMDIAACGRQLFTNAPRGKVHALALAMTNMETVDPKRETLYKEFVRWSQDNTNGENQLIGNKMFWRSDYLINRAKGWYASVRMSSDRTYGFEMTNSENLQGWYSSDGVTYISANGGEYTNIFPVWNWRQLPGLTAQDDGGKLSTKYNFFSNKTDFVGGVTSGQYSVATMRLNRDGLTASKSYFFIDNMMVCLGAGITTEKDLPTTTSIEQSLLSGKVSYGDKSGAQHSLNKLDSMDGHNVHWIHHNSVGYILLDDAHIAISAKSQKGSWSRLATFYRNEPQIEKDVFKIVVNHGKKPSMASYAYAVAPSRTARQTAKLATKGGPKVINNTDQCQAVLSTNGKVLQVVLHKAGSVSINGLYFSASQAGVFVIIKSRDGYSVSMADPTQSLTQINGSVGNSEAKTITFSATLPSGSFAGSSVVKFVK